MRRLVLAVLSLALVAASCADDRPPFDDGASREVDGEPGTTTTSVVPDEPSVFRMGVPGEWSGDPADADPASVTNRALADLLFEGLTRLGPAGLPEPALAERWFVTEDRLTWTFVLPEDLVDGGGVAVTARNVKHSLESVAARGPADQAATALTVVTGWRTHMNGEAGGVAGISAPDETTLVIRLDTAFELLPDVLASPPFGVTNRGDDGVIRTTGAYRWGEGDTLVPVDDRSGLPMIELVRSEQDPAALVAGGLVDWAVLRPGTDSDGIDADVIRQPLDLRVALVSRLPARADRLGLFGAVAPLLLATEVPALAPRSSVRATDEGTAPAAVVVDVPQGILEPLGSELVAQLESAGVTVVPVVSPPAEFAARVSSGEAVLFPVVMAGGTGPAGGLLRMAVPGGVDDVIGQLSAARAELAQAATAAIEEEPRDLFFAALEQHLIDDAFLLPVGQFEARIAVDRGVRGLRHRADGTLDLSGVVATG